MKEVNFDKNILNIGNESFKGCTNLEKITISNKETEIDSSAFYGCRSLQIIETPSDDYKLKDSSFIGCVKLDNNTLLEHTEFGDYLKEMERRSQSGKAQEKSKKMVVPNMGRFSVSCFINSISSYCSCRLCPFLCFCPGLFCNCNGGGFYYYPWHHYCSYYRALF